MSNITEYRYKFSGSQMEIEQELDVDKNVVWLGEAEIVKNEDRSQQDGKWVRIYTLRPKLGQIKQPDTAFYEEPKPSVAKRKSLSQRERDKWYLIWEQEYTHKYKDFDTFYTTVKERIMEIQSLILEGEISVKEFLRY